MKKVIVTTSWDDSHSKNFKLVELLNKYSLKGTFYLDKDRDLSHSKDEIIKISLSQEIGAHSLTHPDLTKIDLNQAEKEIFGSKEWLEAVINKPVRIFAYPFGFYKDEIKKIVKQAGFLAARTTEEFCFQRPEDFFEFGTTLHIYPFPFRKKDKSHYHLSRFLFQPIERKFLKILKLGLPLSSFFSWSNLAKNLFDYVLKNGGLYHLWGHAWEIEKYGMWEDLEKIFNYIANRKNVIYLTNSQILEGHENINFTR